MLFAVVLVMLISVSLNTLVIQVVSGPAHNFNPLPCKVVPVLNFFSFCILLTFLDVILSTVRSCSMLRSGLCSLILWFKGQTGILPVCV